MALSYELFNGTGSLTDFSVNIPFIERDHITLLVDGVSVTFTWVSDSLIRADGAPAVGTGNVQVTRTTPDAALTDFENGSTLGEADLDRIVSQAIYRIQELADDVASTLQKTTDDLWDADGNRITDVGTPTAAADAVTKAYADALAMLAGNVATPDNPGDDGKVLTAAGGAFDWDDIPAPSTALLALLAAANVFTASQEIRSVDADALVGPDLVLNRASPSPANNDTGGKLIFRGKNSADEDVDFASVRTIFTNVTDGAEDSQVSHNSIVDGVEQTQMDVADGVRLGSADFKGHGSINGVLYDAGVAVADSIAAAAAVSPFSGLFESAEQTITSGGTLSIAHGLGAKPKMWNAFLVCKIGDIGYTVGQETQVPTSAYTEWNTASNNIGMSLIASATNLIVKFSTSANVFSLINASTGVVAGITPANWKLVLRAVI